jgi:mandelate racemase
MINPPLMPQLTVRAVRATPVEVPLNFVLGTSMDALRTVPLLLVDIDTEEGVSGRSWLFCYVRAAAPAIASLVGEVERQTRGMRIAPAELWTSLSKRFTLIGVQGIVRMAMSGFDTACWDALAIAANQPLARLLGAEPHPIPAYNSCGLGLMDDLGALAVEAELLLDRGFRAVKLRLGYPTIARDIAAVHAVRKRIGDDVKLMVDYNQALTVDDALERGRALDRKKSIGWRSRSGTTIMPAPRVLAVN